MTPGCIGRGTLIRDKEDVFLLYKAVVRAYLENHVQFWLTKFVKNEMKLKWEQKRAPRMTVGMKNIFFEGNLEELVLFTPPKHILFS